jgi:hypothetical protein
MLYQKNEIPSFWFDDSYRPKLELLKLDDDDRLIRWFSRAFDTTQDRYPALCWFKEQIREIVETQNYPHTQYRQSFEEVGVTHIPFREEILMINGTYDNFDSQECIYDLADNTDV